MANPPLLTPEQRQAALEKAAAARRQRAEVKDKLKIGSLSLQELFDQADLKDETGAMLAKLRVVSVLESLPGIGKVNATRLDARARCERIAALGGVGQNQRKKLLLAAEDADYRRELLNDQRKREGGAASLRASRRRSRPDGRRSRSRPMERAARRRSRQERTWRSPGPRGDSGRGQGHDRAAAARP